MTRRQERGVVIVLMFVFAGLLEYLGSQGWRINLLPAQYIGYLVAGIAMLALAGVNVWHKGPLDPNDDLSIEGSGDASQAETLTRGQETHIR